jgi:hypothetical protein
MIVSHLSYFVALARERGTPWETSRFRSYAMKR